jgi:hypothetical protein
MAVLKRATGRLPRSKIRRAKRACKRQAKRRHLRLRRFHNQRRDQRGLSPSRI